MPLDDPREQDGEMADVLAAGFAPVWHAIGTRAVRELLNLIDRLEAAGLPARRNFRIEHAQHVTDADLPRLAGLRVSMQPLHARDDQQTVARLLGATDLTSYRWSEIAALPGATLLFGSDAPVAEPDLTGGMAAATRHPLRPAESLDVGSALHAYTTAPAAALGWHREEAPWGWIAAGARAVLALWEDGSPVGRVWRGKVEQVPKQ